MYFWFYINNSLHVSYLSLTVKGLVLVKYYQNRFNNQLTHNEITKFIETSKISRKSFVNPKHGGLKKPSKSERAALGTSDKIR